MMLLLDLPNFAFREWLLDDAQRFHAASGTEA